MKKSAKKARIQNAVYGFVIPMRAIPQLYKMLEQAVKSIGPMPR